MPDKLTGKSSESVKKATGKTWDEWIKLLNKLGAKDMPHKDIASLIQEKSFIKKSKSWLAHRSFNVGWWAQSIVAGI